MEVDSEAYSTKEKHVLKHLHWLQMLLLKLSSSLKAMFR
jgi:hypothetical protein